MRDDTRLASDGVDGDYAAGYLKRVKQRWNRRFLVRFGPNLDLAKT